MLWEELFYVEFYLFLIGVYIFFWNNGYFKIVVKKDSNNGEIFFFVDDGRIFRMKFIDVW